MRRIFAIFIMGVLIVPSSAQAGILEFFFPMFREQPEDPMRNNMQAPFATGEGQGQDQGQAGQAIQAQTRAQGNVNAPSQGNTGAAVPQFSLPENNLPLDQAHRSAANISEWAGEAVVKALNFDTLARRTHLQEVYKQFDAFSKQQYLDFLKANKITDVINNNKYFIRSFAQETPLMLNEGPVDGRYRWLVRVPVMVSYVERSKTDYSNAEPINRSYTLTIQIGRVKAADNAHSILIESWDGKPS